MRSLLLLLAFYCTSLLHSQKMDVFVGTNYNLMFDFAEKGVHYYSAFEEDFGYAVSLGYENSRSSFRSMLRLDSYKGSFEASDGALGSGYSTETNYSKTILSLGLYPVKIKVFPRLDINLGMVFSVLLHDSLDGDYTIWTVGQPSKVYPLDNDYSSDLYFGAEARFAYQFPISYNVTLIPQYMAYFGVTNEFTEFPEKVKSLRNFLGVGLSWNLSRNKVIVE